MSFETNVPFSTVLYIVQKKRELQAMSFPNHLRYQFSSKGMRWIDSEFDDLGTVDGGQQKE